MRTKAKQRREQADMQSAANRAKFMHVVNFANGAHQDRSCRWCSDGRLSLHLHKAASGEAVEAHVFCNACDFETYIRTSSVQNELNADRIVQAQ